MNIWDQRGNESPQAYNAFWYYLHLAPTERSIAKAYDVYLSEKDEGRQRGVRKKSKRPPGRWYEWSTTHQWVERATAYDAHIQRKALLKEVNRRQKEVEAFIAADMRMAQAVQRIASKKMAAMFNLEAEDVEGSEFRLFVLSYDCGRKWFNQLLGLFDDEAQPLNELALTDEALAVRYEDEAVS